ncbi:chemokine-like receptor 1 [Arapaima gigas]
MPSPSCERNQAALELLHGRRSGFQDLSISGSAEPRPAPPRPAPPKPPPFRFSVSSSFSVFSEHRKTKAASPCCPALDPQEKETMTDTNTTTFDYDNYDGSDTHLQYVAKAEAKNLMKYMYVGMFSVVFLVGMPLNCLVIITIFCRRRGAVWFLGLAITDFVFCAFLPFHIIAAWNDFNWGFGVILCKMCSYVVFLTMYSTALVVTFMNTDHVLAKLCPRASCLRCKCGNMVLLSWFLAAVLSVPSLIIRVVEFTASGEICVDNYNYDEPSYTITAQGMKRKKAIVYMCLIFGLLLPLVFTGIFCILGILKRNKKEQIKYMQITKAVTFAYFLFWVPYQIMSVFRQDKSLMSIEWLQKGLFVATMLAALNSCIKPVIYFLMGRSADLRWMSKGAAEERGLAEMRAAVDETPESRTAFDVQA